MISGIPFTITKIFVAKRANRNCPNRYKQITQQLKVNASRGGLKRSKIKNHSSFSYSNKKYIYDSTFQRTGDSYLSSFENDHIFPFVSVD